MRPAMAGEHAPQHRAGQLEAGREVRAEVAPVFPVAPVLPQKAERAAPPLDVVVPGNYQGRRGVRETLGKAQRRLQFPVAGALAQVPGEHDRRRVEGGQQRLERRDLLEIRVPAEVKIRKVGEGDRRHHTTLTRYVSATSPFPGTLTRKRVRVLESFSGGTELDSTDHSPPRSSRTSTVAALSLALLMEIGRASCRERG